MSPCKIKQKKKENSKTYALGPSVAIVSECECVLAAHVSVMYTLRICVIGDKSEGACCIFMSFYMLFCGNI